MKTRIEQGSGHVTITCSKALAQAIGVAVVSTYEDWDENDNVEEANHATRFGKALESGQQFEEEEPSDASS